MHSDLISRRNRAAESLEGLSVGDAFGEQFFRDTGESPQSRISVRAIPAGRWRFTDDTNMSLSVMHALWRHDGIAQDALAESFAQRYDRTRGYGAAMHTVLGGIRLGLSWRQVAAELFQGSGSYGNGASMRVAPVGAYFADDLVHAAHQARLCAEVTHAHPEGIAGAMAVAVASALAARFREQDRPPPPIASFVEGIIPFVPISEVNVRLNYVRDLPDDTPISHVVASVGNGSQVSAQDTVPLAIWCAARHLGDYEEALWTTVSALGDRDTTCAIVGGIVASYTGADAIPQEWREAREALPAWWQDGI